MVSTTPNYDHPSFLTRQMIVLGNTTAGASGTSLITNFPLAMRLRNVMGTIVTAGTSTAGGTAGKIDIYVGTSSVGTFNTGTSTAQSTATSGDLNTAVPSGTKMYAISGTDATQVVKLVAEMHVDVTASITNP